ncbi:MAG: single-stranded DNA-binding protein, partial [Bacilli bacterium]
MNNEVEREVKNSKNKFELEGNVANINDIYTNQNGKKILRFDLAQNNNGNTQFVPIVLRGELVNSYGDEIQKGDWISVKGRISTYQKDVERDGKTYKDKAIDILGFEITDRTNNKVYTSDGQVHELTNKEKNQTEMER